MRESANENGECQMNVDQKILKNKVGLLNLSEVLGSMSEACKVMGYPRDSFYRFKLKGIANKITVSHV